MPKKLKSNVSRWMVTAGLRGAEVSGRLAVVGSVLPHSKLTLKQCKKLLIYLVRSTPLDLSEEERPVFMDQIERGNMLTRMCCRCKSSIEKGQKAFVETFCVAMAEQKADLSLELVGGELTINLELCEKCMKAQLNRFNDFFGERAAQTGFASLMPKRRRRRKKATPKEETLKKGGGRPAKKDRAIVKIKDTNKEKTDNTPKKPPPAPKVNV